MSDDYDDVGVYVEVYMAVVAVVSDATYNGVHSLNHVDDLRVHTMTGYRDRRRGRRGQIVGPSPGAVDDMVVDMISGLMA